MATTPENSAQDQEDFASAFNGADPVKSEPTEDEAFGLGPEEQEADGGAGEATEPAQEVADESAAEAPQDGAGDDAPSVVIAVEPGADMNDNAEPTDPKDIQRAKSWEGRLKAREAELKAREDALAGGHQNEEVGESMAQEQAEPAVTEALEDAVEKVQSGECTADQAMANLAGDFGDDFVKMLSVLIDSKASEIAGRTADEKFGQVNQKIDGIVGEIIDDKARVHYESISDTHPDFMDIAESPEFKEYIDGMDETQKEAALKTIDSGSSRAIVKLLGDFKASNQTDESPADNAQEEALSAAEGVRSSGGLKIPEKPKASEDYEDAWAQF